MIEKTQTIQEKKIVLVIFYEELAGYFVTCINHFSEKYKAEIHLFRKELNAVAPFEFNFSQKIKVYDRALFDNLKLLDIVSEINPNAIFTGGWSYKPYLFVSKKYSKKTPVILGFDNQWNGTFKQNIMTFLGGYYLKSHFNKCFVPGEKQKEFALKLGFKSNQIKTKAYCCDYQLYSKYYTESKENTTILPKRFIFVGRYAPEKGISTLWKVFSEIKDKNGWELWCLGKGDLEPFKDDHIKHFGFIQPENMQSFISSTSVLILPSLFEPWGVVTHEFATAGFPIICSKSVGSSELFVENGKNGFLYEANNETELKKAIINVINLSEDELLKMSKKSREISSKITNDIWSDRLFEFITEH